MTKKIAVVAVGGNSLIKDPKRVTVEDQEEALRETSHHIADMIEAGWDVAIGHGNGPQVRTSNTPGWYFKDGSMRTGVPTSKPPTYPTQVCSKSNAKLQ